MPIDKTGLEGYILELGLPEHSIPGIMYYFWHDTSLYIDMLTEALIRKVDLIVVCREQRAAIVAALKEMVKIDRGGD